MPDNAAKFAQTIITAITALQAHREEAAFLKMETIAYRRQAVITIVVLAEAAAVLGVDVDNPSFGGIIRGAIFNNQI